MEHPTASDLQQMFADVADAGTYGCFEYQGVAVGLHSDEADLLNWFDQFFGGYFTVAASERIDAAVYSSRDPAVFLRLKEWATSSGRPRSGDDTEYVVDAHHRIIYSREVDDAKGDVDETCFVLSTSDRTVLVSSPGALKDRQKAVKRSLRNWMKLLFMERGWLPFHSAACIWNDTGICILGGKYAGKTSTLVNLLARPGARLVTNDTLFLRDGGDVLEGCGFPNKAGLRIGALAAYPRLVDWIERTTDSFYPQIDAETFRQVVATTPVDELGSRSEKIVLLSSELAEHPHRARRRDGPLPRRPVRSVARAVASDARDGSSADQPLPGRQLPQPEQGEAGLPPGLLRLRRRHGAGRVRRAGGEVRLACGRRRAAPERPHERALGGTRRRADAAIACACMKRRNQPPPSSRYSSSGIRASMSSFGSPGVRPPPRGAGEDGVEWTSRPDGGPDGRRCRGRASA